MKLNIKIGKIIAAIGNEMSWSSPLNLLFNILILLIKFIQILKIAALKKKK